MSLYLGYIAGTLGTIPMLPQIYKCYITHSTTDLSYISLLISILSSILWTVYGIIIKEIPVTIFSIIFGILNTILLLMKFSFEKSSNNSEN